MQHEINDSRKMINVVSKRRNTLVLILFALGSMEQCLGPLIHPLPAVVKKGCSGARESFSEASKNNVQPVIQRDMSLGESVT